MIKNGYEVKEVVEPKSTKTHRFYTYKNALQSQLVKDTAAGAVVGGALASMIPIPIISTVTGATVGAALGAYKSIGKK